MARKIGFVQSHWHQTIDGLEDSPQRFYQCLEEAIKRRDITDSNQERVEHYEHGRFSHMREYLRIMRRGNVFDVCAAPFGNGFFVSWWFGRLTPSAFFPTFLTLIILSVLWFLVNEIAALIILVVFFFFVGMSMVNGYSGWEEYLLVIPGLGHLWRKIFMPTTFYELDTDLVFRDLVHKCVLDVVDQSTEAKSLRRLTEEERKPVMRDFFKTVRNS